MSEESRDEDFNRLIKILFHGKAWQDRAEAARNLGLLEDGRAVNLLCKALRKEKDHIVVNRIIEALGRIGHPKATLRIIEKLREEQNKNRTDKYRIAHIIESLIKLKDKRALAYIGCYLNHPDEAIRDLTREAFDVIEPDWREIIKKAKQEKTLEEIFKA
ncbi:MAG: PBS lyase HEAT-like repeat protein [Promethearchaeota archaeon]|nr:MAG: PBS lyase HEAT-like repeat protein [Candidatus Lokiarchaeota archaeon]